MEEIEEMEEINQNEYEIIEDDNDNAEIDF